MPEPKDSLEQAMQKLYEKAKAKRNTTSTVKFPGESLYELSSSIDHPIIGILAYLNSSAKAFYGKVSCKISGPQIHTVSFNTDQNPELDQILLPIQPKTYIDIEYILDQPNGEFDIKIITEKVSIYFDHESYELVYAVPGDEYQRFTVTYAENVSLAQIHSLKQLVEDSVLRKVASMIGD